MVSTQQASFIAAPYVTEQPNPNLPHRVRYRRMIPRDDGNSLQRSRLKYDHGGIKDGKSYKDRLKTEKEEEEEEEDGDDDDEDEEEEDDDEERQLEAKMRSFQHRTALLQEMKSCGRRRDLRAAKRIHARMKEAVRKKKDLHLGTGLLSMLAKCGALEEAQQMFDELPDRDAISWNALMGGFILSGHGESVLSCFRQMQEQGSLPNVVTFLCALQACAIMRCIDRGKQIHAEIDDLGWLRKEIGLGTTLVDMYAKCGKLDQAERAFEELPERNVVSWSALIAGYVEHGHGDGALECFAQMQKEGVTPNAITFLCILKACGSIGCLETGEKVHREIAKQGLLHRNLMLGTTLVDMYAKCGVLEKAREAFDRLSEHDVVAWSALITGYAQHGRNDEAFECFRRMLREGIAPDAITFLCVLKACGNEGDLEMGEEIHAQVDEKGLSEHDTVMGNTLVDMYVKCDALGKAHEVLRRLPRRDVVTWSTLIGGYAHRGHGDAALRCFAQMRKEGISPNEVTYMCVLRACGSVGHLGLGKEIHREIDDGCLLGKDMVLGTALVDMYAKCGMLAEAQDVLLAGLPSRDIVSWNALLSGYAQMGCTKQVFELLRRIHDEGLTLEPISFVILLTACDHAGVVDEGQAVFDEMCSRFSSVPPSLEHYSCMMDLFCRAGQFGRSQSILDRVPESDLPPLLLTMLGACHKWKNVELGRWAFERLVELDAGCAPAFVCMRNICDAMEMANAQSRSRGSSALPRSCW